MAPRGNPNWRKGESPNPGGVRRATRLDDIETVTGIGRVGGKADVSITAPSKKRVGQMEMVWSGSQIAARVVQNAPDDAVAAGYEISESLTPEVHELHAEFADTLKTAAYYDRAYGGALILAVTEGDSNIVSEPLVRLTRGALTFRTLTPDNFKLGPEVSNPFSPYYGQAEYATINGVQVHPSRYTVVGYPDSPSILQLAEPSIAQYVQGVTSAAVLTTDFVQTIWRVKGLAQIFATKNRDAIKARIKATEDARSLVNAVLLDSEETFERATASIAGYDILMREIKERMASDCEMPLAMLLGQTPSGLNNSGEADHKFWARTVARCQETLTQAVRWFDSLVVLQFPTQSIAGVRWNPVVATSQKEAAEVAKMEAETAKALVESGIITPEEAATRIGVL